MSGSATTPTTRTTVPTIGPWIPTAVLPLATCVVAAGLCLLVLESPFWRGIGLLLAVVSPAVPTHLPAGGLLLLLGVSQLSRTPSVSDTTFYVLLAGIHLLYVLGSIARLMPWIGRIELAALVRPFKRYVVVQVVTQGVAVTALSLFGGRGARFSGLSIFAAVLVALLAVLLARGVRREAESE